MGKARTNSRGYTREQELIQENRRLKRMLNSLRKQLARLDVDRIDIAKEVIREQYGEEKKEEGREILNNLKKIWACKECEDGYLVISVMNRGNETIYWRACSNAPACRNRTKAQVYDGKLVKGIMRKGQDEDQGG